MSFYAVYKAVFDAVKTAVETKSAIKTVVLGEQFTVGALPKAVINAEPSPVGQAAMGELLEVKVRGSVVLVIREYAPKDWFGDVISVMGDVVDSVLADRTLGGAAFDCYPTGFAPGEIRFTEVEDKLFYGGVVRFEAVVHYEP
jgi:hypothetical protein